MFFSKTIVGIDIGEYAIKIAELSGTGKHVTLKNYAWAKTPESAKTSPDTAAHVIREMMDEAGIATKKAFFAVSDTSYFCTTFEIPPMPEKEVAGAVAYNASRYVTMPIGEVTLDWQIMQPVRAGAALKIFAAAVPNTVIEQYRSIAKKAGLKLIALEAEAFTIKSALAAGSTKVICIIDAGAKSSTITIADRGTIKESYTFTKDPKALAESLKEIDDNFFNQEHKHIEEIYLTGGNITAPGFRDAIAQSIGRPVTIRNCFEGISYPPALKNTLADISPSFAGAVGAALNGLQLNL